MVQAKSNWTLSRRKTGRKRRDKCPLEPVHRRLKDAVSLWLAADRAYFSPEAFRRNLNACIQAARSVTFVLQKQKSVFPDFPGWYTPWQDNMRRTSTLRWLVEARNHIEKEGDLEAASVMRVSLIDSYLQNASVEYSLPPRLKPDHIANEFARASGEGLTDASLLIERRWCVSTLPDHEVLSAIAQALHYYADLLIDAHRILGIRHTTDEVGGLRQKESITNGRSTIVRIDTHENLVVESRALRPTRSSLAAAAERYGAMPPLDGINLRDKVANFFEYAKRILEVDGYHRTFVFLFRKGKLIGQIEQSPQDKAEKYVLWREVATKVRASGADAVITVGELWRSRIDVITSADLDLLRPDGESIQASGESKDGTTVTLFADFVRDEVNGIVFRDTVDASETAQGIFMEPIRAVWRSES